LVDNVHNNLNKIAFGLIREIFGSKRKSVLKSLAELIPLLNWGSARKMRNIFILMALQQLIYISIGTERIVRRSGVLITSFLIF
jgi:hypothetical protein